MDNLVHEHHTEVIARRQRRGRCVPRYDQNGVTPPTLTVMPCPVVSLMNVVSSLVGLIVQPKARYVVPYFRVSTGCWPRSPKVHSKSPVIETLTPLAGAPYRMGVGTSNSTRQMTDPAVIWQNVRPDCVPTHALPRGADKATGTGGVLGAGLEVDAAGRDAEGELLVADSVDAELSVGAGAVAKESGLRW